MASYIAQFFSIVPFHRFVSTGWNTFYLAQKICATTLDEVMIIQQYMKTNKKYLFKLFATCSFTYFLFAEINVFYSCVRLCILQPHFHICCLLSSCFVQLHFLERPKELSFISIQTSLVSLMVRWFIKQDNEFLLASVVVLDVLLMFNCRFG